MEQTLTCCNETWLWLHPAAGHQYEVGQRGRLLNGRPVDAAPAWADGPPLRLGRLIRWRGGDCPVPPGVIVRALFRGRRPYVGPAIWPGMPERGRATMWRHAPSPGRSDPNADIIAYQVAL